MADNTVYACKKEGLYWPQVTLSDFETVSRRYPATIWKVPWFWFLQAFSYRSPTDGKRTVGE